MKPPLQARILAGLSSRVILIMITVAAATGGFILGYLVGEKSSSVVDVVDLKQQAVDSSPQKNEKTSADAMPIQGQVTAQTAPSQNPAAQINNTPLSTSTAQLPAPQQSKSPASNEALAVSSAGPSTSQNSGKEKLVESVSDTKSDSKQDATSNVAPLNEDNAYYVQAGAFSSRSKADGLKHTLDGKGYKTTIRKWVSKKHKTFYKVIAGEFSRKEEAEVLALRLKKTDGLSASVNRR